MSYLRAVLMIVGVMMLTGWFALVLSAKLELPYMDWGDFLVGIGIPTVGAGLITGSLVLRSRD